MFTICVLLYGNYPQLARRCLESLKSAIPFTNDIRIGCNSISEETTEVLHNNIRDYIEIADRLNKKLTVSKYIALGNVFKYPTMRRMFHDENQALEKYTVWFDDDSVVVSNDFWQNLQTVVTSQNIDILGQLWQQPVNNNFINWLKTQRWYNDSFCPSKTNNKITFCQGAWWCIRSELIKELDWPIPELKHCGGDSLLGIRLAMAGYSHHRYSNGVAINADNTLKPSTSKRRGFNERNFAHDYTGQTYSTDHQNFVININRYTSECGIKQKYH